MTDDQRYQRPTWDEFVESTHLRTGNGECYHCGKERRGLCKRVHEVRFDEAGNVLAVNFERRF